MEEHHWGGQGWNPAVEPEEEEDLGVKIFNQSQWTSLFFAVFFYV
jgi:hypothetical protein